MTATAIASSSTNGQAVGATCSVRAGPTRVLFLAANPASLDRMEMDRLSLDREVREITNKIRESELRNSFELVTRWAVTADDLMQHLNEIKPEIVHFSGHGIGVGASHGSHEGGLVFAGESGDGSAVTAEALKRLFGVLKDNIRLVVLNACLSEPQARAIHEHIDFVVGMSAEISDEAAITFSGAFYRALGFGRSVRQAFEQGRVALDVLGVPESATPRLFIRPGADADAGSLVSPMENRRIDHPTPWRWIVTGLGMVLLTVIVIVGIRSMTEVQLAHRSQATFSVRDVSTGVRLPLSAASDTPRVGTAIWTSFLNPHEKEPTYLLVQEGNGQTSIYPDEEVRAAGNIYKPDHPGTFSIIYLTLSQPADDPTLFALKSVMDGQPPPLGQGQHVVWSWKAPVIDDAPSKRGLGVKAPPPPEEWMKRVMDRLKAAGVRTVSGRSFHVDPS